jgi:hypothetical protein
LAGSMKIGLVVSTVGIPTAAHIQTDLLRASSYHANLSVSNLDLDSLDY